MKIEEQIALWLQEASKPSETSALPNHCYFLKDGILSLPDAKSDARHPYVQDGLTLWTHQNGKVSLNESNHFLIQETLEGESSHLSFFLGIKGEDGYEPVSLFDFNRILGEKGVKRATIFLDSETVYLLQKDGFVYALRIGLNAKKELLLELILMNQGKEAKEIYSSSFFDFQCAHSNFNSVETKWFRKVSYEDGLYSISTVEDLSRTIHLHNQAYLKRFVSSKASIEDTTSREVYCDSKTGRVEASENLLRGGFLTKKNVTCFSDLSVCGDFVKKSLQPGESLKLAYVFSMNEATRLQSIEDVEEDFAEEKEKKQQEYGSFSFLQMNFERGEEKWNAPLFTSFMKEVVKQVDYCATSKNSTLMMLGMRDCFQAYEAGVLFAPSKMRKRILETLNYVYEDGRLPRQYASTEEQEVRVDNRAFIDQGIWAIDAIYQYLAYTGDFLFLKEECSYLQEGTGPVVKKSEEKGSVLDHLCRIADYLVSHLDPDTQCLQILYGDWNDAVDGLGKGESEEGFGNGVSIMASFQLYSCLKKMEEILLHEGEKEKAKEYRKAREILNQGLREHAFAHLGNETKVLHGWGEDASYYVGSFADVDGKERDSCTPNAFYVLSGYAEDHGNVYLSDVKKAFGRLDSPYGLKTFEPGFGQDAAKVGRIVNLPLGTAENGATYIHGAVFGIGALFEMNEPRFAFDELYKVLPITHVSISTTPFVMPNSYGRNLNLGVDGESMNDWYTGSSNTILKTLVRDVFGIKPSLDSIAFFPVSYVPFEKAELSLPCQGKTLHVSLLSKGESRKAFLNGKEIQLEKHGIREGIFLPKALLSQSDIYLEVRQ